ncbi:CYTH domain-containing protein [Lactobacillus mulieris]|uniref:CYTH domain-containing protein n=1 Tax=Lactobacillus mulieris TaxID=2508708 RepID=A0AAW5WZ02_9LACO|nr:CYTH domain-containing protein [Lactobacillus mulieris]MCZ3622618.1 CYTH domain-containing protein [Lactobacillus mulieris]MCZ3624256.1 CYTH domain-containing protein [Lactobacillus mulieris]MCZ3636625.1 CYTH domain-containing protein [Lactobacillus mulieris]MCZ3690314.1 CYTH domain-containing protein [Lactobacillus mulieris]MCZ3696283.1 CYTH domain-containing protein [Lactobacillus mulieris]
MSKNREIESKTLLEKDVFSAILKTFPSKKSFTQINYYFDDDKETLKNNKISLRIRLYPDKAEQTMKVPAKKLRQESYHEVIEINDPLSLKVAQEIVENSLNGGVTIFGNNCGKYLSDNFSDICQELKIFSYSKTTRHLLVGPNDCELTLDETSYPDRYQDFELEIENDNPDLIKQTLNTLIQQFNFHSNPQNTNQNKIARASLHRN